MPVCSKTTVQKESLPGGGVALVTQPPGRFLPFKSALEVETGYGLGWAAPLLSRKGGEGCSLRGAAIFRGNASAVSSVERNPKSYLKQQLGEVCGASPGGAHRPSLGDTVIHLGTDFLPHKREEGRAGAGEREREREDVFLLDVIQAESQSAHVNELENAIKNIYILQTVIQNLMGDTGCKVTNSISDNQC